MAVVSYRNVYKEEDPNFMFVVMERRFLRDPNWTCYGAFHSRKQAEIIRDSINNKEATNAK